MNPVEIKLGVNKLINSDIENMDKDSNENLRPTSNRGSAKKKTISP